MNTPPLDLVEGRWRRIGGDPRAERYPDGLKFLRGGVYIGQAGERQGFVMWGGGDYEVIPPDKIKLQIQTDAMVADEISATGQQLRFRDSDGCMFTCRRAE